MDDPLAEARLAREMVGEVNGIVVAGKFGKTDDVLALDLFAIGLAHAEDEVLEIIGPERLVVHFRRSQGLPSR